MILYQPPQNRSWKPLRGKALRLLIFNISAVDEAGKMGGTSGHGVQKIYKKGLSVNR